MNKEQYCAITNERIEKFWERNEDRVVSEEVLESLVSRTLEDYWELFGEELGFQDACDLTQVHQDIVRVAYEKFMEGQVVEGI